MNASRWISIARRTVASACLIALAGCQTPAPPSESAPDPHAELILREGDVVKISFPRKTSQGGVVERDMHQGQQYVRLLSIELT